MIGKNHVVQADVDQLTGDLRLGMRVDHKELQTLSYSPDIRREYARQLSERLARRMEDQILDILGVRTNTWR